MGWRKKSLLVENCSSLGFLGLGGPKTVHERWSPDKTALDVDRPQLCLRYSRRAGVANDSPHVWIENDGTNIYFRLKQNSNPPVAICESKACRHCVRSKP